MDTKLKSILREPEFWLLAIVSLPGLTVAVATALRAAFDAVLGNQITYDSDSATLSLLGLPIVLYLGFGRQLARKGAAIGAGQVIAAQTVMLPELSGEEANWPDDDTGDDVLGEE